MRINVLEPFITCKFFLRVKKYNGSVECRSSIEIWDVNVEEIYTVTALTCLIFLLVLTGSNLSKFFYMFAHIFRKFFYMFVCVFTYVFVNFNYYNYRIRQKWREQKNRPLIRLYIQELQISKRYFKNHLQPSYTNKICLYHNLLQF